MEISGEAYSKLLNCKDIDVDSKYLSDLSGSILLGGGVYGEWTEMFFKKGDGSIVMLTIRAINEDPDCDDYIPVSTKATEVASQDMYELIFEGT